MGLKIKLKYYNAVYLKNMSVPETSSIVSNPTYGNSKWFGSVNTGYPWRKTNTQYYSNNDLPYLPNWWDFTTNNDDQDGPHTNAWTSPMLQDNTLGNNFIIEEARITGGFNKNSIGLPPRAYLVEKENKVRYRENALIYSGIFNSRTGVNESNVFASGEDITKGLDKNLGSVQKLFALDNNLTIFQENKVSQAMIDKDAVYTQEGQPITTKSNVVIGAIQPYVGDFGISRNPESFASFGFRRYFTDKDRNSVLRLSRDGLTEISDYGMSDYFRDTFSRVNENYVVYESAEFLISSQSPQYPNPNPNVFPQGQYVSIAPSGLVPVGGGDFSFIEPGAGVSFYMAGGRPKNSEQSIVSPGSGYSNAFTYSTSGGSGSGAQVTLDFGGGVAGVVSSVDFVNSVDLSGYREGDILDVVSVDPSTGAALPGSGCQVLLTGVQDNGSGVWYDIQDGYVRGVTYDSQNQNVANRVMLNTINIGRDNYSAYKIRFKVLKKDEIVGSYDVYKNQYLLSINRGSGSKSKDEISDYNNENGYYSTLTFDEKPKGWTTFYTYRPFRGFSIKNTYFTVKKNQLYSHYTSDFHNNFYGITSPSSIEFIFNQNPSVVKNFRTINYEGSNGWQVDSIKSDKKGPIDGNYYFDESYEIPSNQEGAYNVNNVNYNYGFNVKENKYFASILNSSPATYEEVLGGEQTLGVKGFFVNVTMSTDQTTDPGNMKELFSVASEISISSR